MAKQFAFLALASAAMFATVDKPGGGSKGKLDEGQKAVEAAKREILKNEPTVERDLQDTTLPLAAERPVEERLAGTQANEEGPRSDRPKDATPMPAGGPYDPAMAQAGVQEVYDARPPRNLPYEREERLVASTVERVVGKRKLEYVEDQLVEALEPSFINNRTYDKGDRFRYTGELGSNLAKV